MASIEPAITVRRHDAGYRVVQNRPPAGGVLARLVLDDALAQVNNLLPICGQAQSIAAARAVNAAQGRFEDAETSARQDTTLLREQVQSSIWRLTVDWPGHLGEERDLATLRTALRTAGLDALRELLNGQLDGLHANSTADDLEEWLSRRACLASRFVSRALEADTKVVLPDSGPQRSPDEVLTACRVAAFWPPSNAPLDPPTGEVGAMAMARHELSHGLSDRYGALVRRLLAQVLDAAFLVMAEPAAAGLGQGATAERLDSGGAVVSAAGSESPSVGIGWAMTARGPLVHRVVLAQAEADRAMRWDVLAPTDWHFASAGPVTASLVSCEAPPAFVRWFVAGFDPCAAWSVQDQDQEGPGAATGHVNGA